MALSKVEKRRRCVGCHDDRYNQGRGYRETERDAMVTCDECWSLKSATSCNKLVYYSPGDYKPFRRDKTLSCWHNNMGYGTVVK